MKVFTKVFLVSSLLLSSHNTYAIGDCFIAKENGKIVKQVGDCTTRRSPASTFKVPLAVIGFDSGILYSPTEPELPYNAVAQERNDEFYSPSKYPIMILATESQTPYTWMQKSVIWYSQEIVSRLGYEKFNAYVKQLNYGNMDVSGDKDKGHSYLRSWIFSSLKISPIEQIEFMEKLYHNTLPVSKEAQENTKAIMKLDNLWLDWDFYGKTGGSSKQGSFVGWATKDDRTVFIYQYIEPKCETGLGGGTVARELAKVSVIPILKGRDR